MASQEDNQSIRSSPKSIKSESVVMHGPPDEKIISESNLSKPAHELLKLNEDYLAALAEIEKHNQIINELKKQIEVKANLPIKTCITEKELQCLRFCLQKEFHCLKKLTQRTIEKQAQNPNQPWGPIPLSTTLEEDHMPRLMLYTNAIFPKAQLPEPSPKELTCACVQENLIAENVELEDDKYKLEEEVANRDKMIECLQQKMQCLQFQLTKLCLDKGKSDPFQQKPCCSDKDSKDNSKDYENEKLKTQLDHLTCSLNRLQIDLFKLQQSARAASGKCPQICGDSSPQLDTSSCSDCGNYNELKQQHQILIREYAKQSCKVEQLKKELDPLVNNGGKGEENSTEKAELDICRNRIKDLQNEADEFKILITEQHEQLEEYRMKYMKAQQTVLEQKCHLEKMELSNKKIEEQINCEVKRIKAKFQEKLKELAPLPQLLASEQCKNKELCKCKQDLECKLSMVCDELTKQKKELKKLSANGDDQSWETKCKNLCTELTNLKQTFDRVTAEKKCIEQQLQQAQQELECIRSESARIISRLKERFECTRESLQSRIDTLELDLAQCRANTTLTLGERDELIRLMKNQLNELSCNFDATQIQIRNLKTRMSVMAEEHAP